MSIRNKLYKNFGWVLAMVIVLFLVNLVAVQREHNAKAAASQALQMALQAATPIVIGDAVLSVNALAFPYTDLARRPPGTRRSTDIVPHGEVALMIDAVQAGVGGNNAWDSGGRPMQQYRIPLAPRSYGFRLVPFANDGTHPDAAKPAAAAALR